MTKKIEFFKNFLLYMLIALFSVSLFLYSSEIRETIIISAKNCALRVIPSLFPFMIISKIIVALNMACVFENTLGRAMRKLYNLPAVSAVPFLLGITCSFPIGAKASCELFEMNKINGKEAERIIALSNNAGPAFVIGAVGEIYWGSKAFGALVYAVQIISAILCGFLLCRDKKAPASSRVSSTSSNDKKSFLAVLSDSIASSAISVLSVSAFVIFFSVFIRIIILAFGINSPVFCAVISSMAEFSSGVLHSANLGGVLGAAITGFSIGFGGLSVICQSVGFCSKHGISIKRAVIFKFLQGLVSAVLIYAATSMFPGLILNRPYKTTFLNIASNESYFIFGIVAAAAILFVIKNKVFSVVTARRLCGK